MKMLAFRRSLTFSLLSVIGLLAHVVGPADAIPGADESRAPRSPLLRHLIPGTEDVQLIVELNEPSVIEALVSAPSTTLPHGAKTAAAMSVDLKSALASDARARVRASQEKVAELLRSVNGANIQETVDTVLNAIIVRVPAAQFPAVTRLSGVRRVHFARQQKLQLDTSAALHRAAAMWDKLGGSSTAGRGAKIGIIDTGIDIDNPMFIDSSLSPPSGYPKGESAFTNNKVIVARNYVALLPNSQSVRTALDEVGHGSFVAGCAAGKQVTAPLATISGMAPGAFLGSYKVFGTPGINDSTTDSAVIAAVNAAVNDGMDVLNLSLGSLDYLPADEDPEINAINNAVSAGVVVVISAGNDGPETHTVANPGTAPSAITVGAVTNSRIFATLLRATAPTPVPDGLQNVVYTLGTGPAVSSPIASTPIVDVATLDGDGEGCSAFPSGSLQGKLAFIKRGTCLFSEKVGNAYAAGALVAVIYNNVPGATAIVMGGLGSAKIPAVMVSNPDGVALKEFITTNPAASRVEIDASLQPVPKASKGGVITDFSSRGPGSDLNLKPDLVAVGDDVYSAAQNNNANGMLYNAQQFTISRGTSFSSPMVAGAAAALRAQNRSLTPDGVKSLLVNTSNRELATEGGSVAGVLNAGTGLLDMGRAAEATAIFAPASLSFGVSSYSGVISVRKTVNVTNLSSSTDDFAVVVTPTVPGAAVTLSRDTISGVSGGGSASFDVLVTASAPASGGFQGIVTVTSQRTGARYRIPYWAGLYVTDRSRVLTVSRTGGAAYGSLEDALRDARPGNVVEIGDDATYAGGIVVATNAAGLPLHDITIRAAAGKAPVIAATSTADVNLSIVGLRNVLLQGLTISGGVDGIDIHQPAASQPASATIDRCIVTGSRGSSYTAGIYLSPGATAFVTRTTVKSSGALGIVADAGSHLTVSDSLIDGTANDALDAFSANVQILRSTIRNVAGAGAYLGDCSGTISASTFSLCRGSYGDGIEVVDGAMSISGCTFESNDRAGVGYFADTGVGGGGILDRNTFRSNRYGALFNPAYQVRVEGNYATGNNRGFRFTNGSTATVLNNIVVDSTDSSVGDGVQIAAGSAVALTNNTISRNRRKGISFAGGNCTAVNSIVCGNTAGDLEGLTASNVQYCLIGDGSLSSGNNISGDPRFVNPDGGDFSLASGSPAIDAGNNAATDLPFLDYSRRIRVASAGAVIGDGKVDLGALEYGANYPLVFPLLANGPQSSLQGSFATGFALLNIGNEQVSAAAFAMDPAGAPLAGSKNPTTRTFGARSQVPIFDHQLFDFEATASRIGSVLIASAKPLVGFFLVFDNELRRFADGVDVSDQTSTELILMRHLSGSSGSTSYIVVNPGVNPANLKATLYTPSGTMVGTPRSAVLPAHGQLALSFDGLTLENGYVRVQSDRPVSALELFGNADVLSAIRAAVTGTEGRLYFPHFAVNGGFTSLIGIVNSGNRPAEIVLTAHASNGTLLAAPVSRTIVSGGQLLESVADIFGLPSGALSTGYIIGKSNRGGVSGFTAFRYEVGLARSAAAVPAMSVPAPRLLFSHVAHQVAAGSGGTYQTGIALLNPFGVPVSYTLRVFDGNGTELATVSDTLGAGEKVAKILSHPIPGVGFFTKAIPLGSGHIEVAGDLGLLGFELFFTEDFSQLASVPAQLP